MSRVSERRRGLGRLATVLVVAAGLLVGIAATIALSNRPSGVSGPSGIESSGAPNVSSAVSSASPAETMPPETPISTAGQDAWAEFQVVDADGYSEVWGILEYGDTLLAFGRSGRDALGMWQSADGMKWNEVATPPEPPKGLGGRVEQVVLGRDGLLALATLGNPEGGGIEATRLYSSPDGNVWTAIGSDTPPLSKVASADGRLVGGGNSGFWISVDDGTSWQAADSNAVFAGVVADVTHRGRQFVAVGYVGDLAAPRAVIWTSDDGGLTWREEVIDEDGAARLATVTSAGGILVFGEKKDQSVVWSSSPSGWTATPLGTCCLRAAAATQSGTVAIGLPYSGGDTYIMTSGDAASWGLRDTLAGRVNGATATDLVGLAVTTDRGTVLIAPTPYP